jgi:thiol:disulfide interchange protein
MKRWLWFVRLVSCCLVMAVGVAAQQTNGQQQSGTEGGRPAAAASVEKAAEGKYVPVHKYDPARDAALDIREAVAEARRTGKRVLLEVGGEWCIWCHIMDAFFEKNPELLKSREQNFVMLKINFSEENKNQPVLSRYPPINGYPHIFVLDHDGKLLQSQDTAELEDGKSYNPAKFTAFLNKWSPAEKSDK